MYQIISQSCCLRPQSLQYVQGSPYTLTPPTLGITQLFCQSNLASVATSAAEIMCFCFLWPCPFPATSPPLYFLLTANTSYMHCQPAFLPQVHSIWILHSKVPVPTSCCQDDILKLSLLPWCHHAASAPFSGSLTLNRACNGFLSPVSSTCTLPSAFKVFKQ